MPRARPRPTTSLGVLALWVALSGCAPEGLAFRTDERLTIVAPADRSTVRLPVVIDWDIRDFDVVPPGGEPRGEGGYFAVFVDTSPVPPGTSLRHVARNDSACRAADGCPDEEYLRARGIHTTTETRLVLDQLPRTGDDDDRERHRATIVLLDPAGERIGESAFEVAFDVERADPS